MEQELIQSGPLGVAVLALGYVVLRLYRDNTRLQSERMSDAKQQTQQLLDLNDKVHETIRLVHETIGKKRPQGSTRDES